ncbi:MAG TPA: maleylpyruvate isomerase family mycothiol-dependent enzyme [Actinomycetes bacterium]|nr:maleylpyruvate isomerase family mycothiol-dependent enzyme [Actinomycetes bacterium]
MIELSQVGPLIDVRGLFAKERSAFLELLGGVGVGDWDRATVCPGWTVKDVTAHVLHDDLRRLAGMRDGHQGPPPEDGEPLADFSRRVNQEWVAAARCLSTRQLVELLTLTGGQVARMWQQQDLQADGTAVSWAGLDASPVWLDAARELTEYWTHQQQVRDATSRPGLTGREFLAPVLETFLRALPFTLRDADAALGAQVQVTITGDAPMRWVATREGRGWWLDRGAAARPLALIEADGDTIWRLCTRGITPQAARARVRVHGDLALADQVLEMVSIIR